MRRGKGLVQIEMDGVEAHVAWPADAHQRVEVGTVVVELRPDLVDQLGDLENVALEQAQGVRVGEHERGHPARELAAEVGNIDSAIRSRANLDHGEAAEGSASRIGPVGTVGDQNLIPLLPSGLMVDL